MQTGFRNLPSVDKLISDPRLQPLEATYPRTLVVDAVRQVLDQTRQSIALGQPAPSFDAIVTSILGAVESLGDSSLRPVINATGVVLHTNLGRAPLSAASVEAMTLASAGYNNLEFDLESGVRGSRDVHVDSLLCRLTGAESALVVNNNALAVLLGLTAFARRKEVIVSRGQAVEIGGGFRIPDVMRQSGARLVEVGTTNCTYLSDYEQAITPRTAILLRVHSSNFKVVGFVEEVPLEDMVELGKAHDLPIFDDLGSGCLLDTTRYGLAPEPRVQDSIAAGAGAAFFSGDKLLGGPQAGIIVGRKHIVDKLRKHPLARAARIDKIRLAALAVTLLHYLKGEAEQKIPAWQMIATPLPVLESRARNWWEQLGELASVERGVSVVGGGSLPGSTLPTVLVVIKGSQKAGSRISVQGLARRLRLNQPPVIGRIEGNSLLLDPRTVSESDDRKVIDALRTCLGL